MEHREFEDMKDSFRKQCDTTARSALGNLKDSCILELTERWNSPKHS